MSQKGCQIKDKTIQSYRNGNYGKLLLIHSYECQRIQIKNLFDEILGLGFDLEHLKVNTYQASKQINFAKDSQKDLYNKTILMGKKKRIKNLLTTLKKHSYLKKCGILKL
jgi:hypothetical protein